MDIFNRKGSAGVLKDKSKTFEINGVKLEIPADQASPRLVEAFESGKYEHLEARQIPRFMKDGDSILELGAGVGFISSLAGKRFKLSGITAVEANPQLIPTIKRNFELNKINGKILNCLCASRSGKAGLNVDSSGNADFYLRENFWGSSLDSKQAYKEAVKVPVRDFQQVIDEAKPTIIVSDIEGGEYDLFERVDLTGVRGILMEVHKGVIGLEGIDKVAHTLRGEGLYYDPDYSVGAVVFFSR